MGSALLSTVCAGLLIGCHHAQPSTGPAPLLTAPTPSSAMAFRRGELYLLFRHNGYWAIEAVPAHGGRPREVAQLAPETDPSPSVVFTEDSAIITPGRGPQLAHPSTMSVRPGGSGAGGGGAETAGGTAAADRATGDSGIRQVPLTGGIPMPIVVDTSGRPIESVYGVVIGSALYWLYPGAGAIAAVPQTIMVSPLDGRPPHRIATGLSTRALQGGTDAVFWYSPVAAGADRPDLQYYVVANGRRGVIHRFDGRDLPVLGGGSAYWISPGGIGGPDAVMKTDLSDSHRTKLASGSTLGIKPVKLWAGNGALYLLCSRSTRRESAGGDGSTPHRSTDFFLARVDESRPDSLRGEEKVPRDIRPLSAAIGGDALFCFVSLSHGEDAETAYGLYRTPLPH